ncbi:MAG: hypothetical protein JNL07_02985 [Rhodospirillales bacterium]|nr:hypothetical protein [Rhodospirillales bacterium]
MAEILALGLTHYPPLCGSDDDMAGILRWTLQDPAIPPALKDPANWPDAMRREWGDDGAAAAHRAALVGGFARVRAALDAFAPDVVLIWGDDQYENFREDVIPPFTVCAYPDMVVRPWADAKDSSAMRGKANVWGEGPDHAFTLRGRPDIARHLATGLLESGIDVAYAYKPLHHHGVAHAFLNAVLFLDYGRRGFDHPVVTFPLNCYGRRVISCKGFLTRMGDPVEFDPPSPSPRRFMEMGAAAARVLRASPWRVALVASSSWSHAFLCDKTHRLRPDTPADRHLYDALRAGDFDAWRRTSLREVEDAGQQEVLNWFALMGAVEALGARLDWSDWVETSIFNSNKVFAAYHPA